MSTRIVLWGNLLVSASYVSVSLLSHGIRPSPLGKLNVALSIVYFLTAAWMVFAGPFSIKQNKQHPRLSTTFLVGLSLGLGICTTLLIPVLYSIPAAFWTANALAAPGEVMGRAISAIAGWPENFQTLQIFSKSVNCFLFSLGWFLFLAMAVAGRRRHGKRLN